MGKSGPGGWLIVKSLLCKCEGLSSNPKHSHKSQVWWDMADIWQILLMSTI